MEILRWKEHNSIYVANKSVYHLKSGPIGQMVNALGCEVGVLSPLLCDQGALQTYVYV